MEAETVRTGLVGAGDESYANRLLSTVQEAIHDDINDNDEVMVEKFKYEQQLERNLTITSVIGLGFGLMSPPLSLGATMAPALVDGGPATIMGGYIIVFVFSFICALSLAEICSKYPIEFHGGAAIIAHPRYSLICSWFTGFFLLVGNWLVSVSITFAGAQLILSVFGIYDSEYELDTVLTVVMFYVVVTVCGIVNLFYSRYMELINKLCVYWIIYAILLIDILLLLFAGEYHSLSYIFTHFDYSLSGWPGSMAFMIGMQQANFMFQGFALLPAVSDEVKEPEKTVPRGLVLSILIAGAAGFIFIIPILAVIPDVASLIGHENGVMPIVLIFKLATRSKIVSFFLVVMIIGNLIFSGIGAIATSSRAVFAMSRDGALPLGHLWTFVDEKSVSKVPKYSVLLCMAVSYLLGLLALVSTAAFNAFVGAAVLSLCAASLIPIISSLLGARKKVRGAAFKLKYVGFILNIISVFWLMFTIFVLSMPPQIPVSGTSMNYASLVFVVFVLLIMLLWIVWGKYNFHGPLVDHDHNERVGSIPMETLVGNESGYQRLDEHKFQKLDAESIDETMENTTMSTNPERDISHVA